MKVSVTQDHIDKGIQREANCCPVALAISEMGFENCSATASRIILDYHYEFITPKLVADFINNFDTPKESILRKNVKPIEFELNKSDKLISTDFI